MPWGILGFVMPVLRRTNVGVSEASLQGFGEREKRGLLTINKLALITLRQYCKLSLGLKDVSSFKLYGIIKLYLLVSYLKIVYSHNNCSISDRVR